jgi:hypothetical protein
MKLEAVGTWLTTMLLIVSGAIGIAIGVSDVFGLEHYFAEKKPTGVLVSLVGLIALSLGLERAIYHRKLQLHLDHVEKLLASQVGGRMMRGGPEIYSAAIQPVAQAHRSLRTIIYGKAPKAPAEFGMAVARRLRETKASGNPIYFEVVFAFDFKRVPQDFQEGVERRLGVFQRLGVADQVRLRVLDCNDRIGFDILLIDDQHVFFSFPVIHGTADVQTSIFFESQAALCRELNSWFEERVKSSSRDYREWVRTASRKG